MHAGKWVESLQFHCLYNVSHFSPAHVQWSGKDGPPSWYPLLWNKDLKPKIASCLTWWGTWERQTPTMITNNRFLHEVVKTPDLRWSFPWSFRKVRPPDFSCLSTAPPWSDPGGLHCSHSACQRVSRPVLDLSLPKGQDSVGWLCRPLYLPTDTTWISVPSFYWTPWLWDTSKRACAILLGRCHRCQIFTLPRERAYLLKATPLTVYGAWYEHFERQYLKEYYTFQRAMSSQSTRMW